MEASEAITAETIIATLIAISTLGVQAHTMALIPCGAAGTPIEALPEAVCAAVASVVAGVFMVVEVFMEGVGFTVEVVVEGAAADIRIVTNILVRMEREPSFLARSVGS
jgi:hypothetical protein